MPTRDTNWPAGTPCWVDYGASDLDGAKDLYAELFGWELTGGGEEHGGYAVAQLRGLDVAGLGPQMSADQPVAWATWFAADDVAATAARVREAGGSVIVEPMDVGPMGRMAYALDPQGNAFGLWQGGTNTGVRLFNEPGSLVWTDGAVDDLAAAQEFYSALFGWSWEDVPGMEGQYRTFALADGRPLGGLGARSEGTPPGWTVCFAAASTDDAVVLVERRGGRTLMPAQDTEFGRLAVLADPWGATFSVMQLPAEQ